ncbi:hypothetical protein Cgig2_023682 [Carnegiea gigantea]|uniref:F-box domain-containing protein n=1 Tax=Carnegiea gigantea TaxID=171969 RepID=A0A9Q1KJE8_9CARY|nr:hypothetical protein Cgig2_023682 [Carnegiea gigantea]
MASNFPMDVMYTILTLLSVKSLLRFRSVCKTWCNLIDSPGFIKFHLDRSLASNSNHSLIFTQRNDSWSLYQVHDLDTLSSATKITCPGTRISIIIGACNGLICACVDNSIVLCNLSMCTFRHIHHREKVTWKTWKCFGFGYDCLRDDYKIVMLFCRELSEVFVYSLRDNSWKTLTGKENVTDSYSRRLQRGVLANNCFCWIQGGPGDEQVIVFDLHHQEWSMLPLPNETNFLILQLGFFDGHLCLHIATNHPTFHSKVKCDIWCMKDFDYEGAIPLVYCNRSNEIIFKRYSITNHNLLKGKLGQGKIKNFEFDSIIQHNFSSEMITTYVDSLTPVGYYHRLPRSREETDIRAKKRLSLNEVDKEKQRREVGRGKKGRCVCKAWRNLIDSSDFMQFHLNRSLESNFIHCL